MAKPLRKDVVRQFAAAVARAGFSRHEEASPYVSQYEVAFSRMPTIGDCAPFIILLFDHRGRSRISVEIGWSSNRQFPRLSIRPSGEVSPDRKEFRERDFLARLSTLWGESDYWWEIESGADVPTVIGEVMRRLETFGYPYLAEREKSV